VADITSVGSSNGVAFLVSAGIMYEIIAAACSSPQTAEINAAKRSETLMKWVKIGIVQGIFFIVVAAMIDRKKALPILTGGALAGGLMGACYYHANVAGLRSAAEGTEQY
jgi:hypothetical protein